jgi:hypothetical protein
LIFEKRLGDTKTDRERCLTHTRARTHARTHAHVTFPLNEWSARRRDCYLHYAQQTQETNIRAFSGIRNRDPRSQAAAGLRLRPHGHRERLFLYFLTKMLCMSPISIRQRMFPILGFGHRVRNMWCLFDIQRFSALTWGTVLCWPYAAACLKHIGYA